MIDVYGLVRCCSVRCGFVGYCRVRWCEVLYGMVRYGKVTFMNILSLWIGSVRLGSVVWGSVWHCGVRFGMVWSFFRGCLVFRPVWGSVPQQKGGINYNVRSGKVW